MVFQYKNVSDSSLGPNLHHEIRRWGGGGPGEVGRKKRLGGRCRGEWRGGEEDEEWWCKNYTVHYLLGIYLHAEYGPWLWKTQSALCIIII